MTLKNSFTAIAFVSLAAFFRFAALGMEEMQQWDEGLYAVRTLAAVSHGAVWDQAGFLPDGPYYVAHPPLYVWLTSIVISIAGNHVWAFRLISALAGAATVFLCWYVLGKHRVSLDTRLTVTSLAAVVPLTIWGSTHGQLDALLGCLMFGCLICAGNAVFGPADSMKRCIVWSAVLLGLALMTKILVALIVPLALLVSALLFSPDRRKRLAGSGIAISLLSIPLWAPWIISFTMKHGGGDPFFLFSPGMPFGATAAGTEGTVKDTGRLFYANQLVIVMGAFLPLLPTAIVNAVRARDRQTVLAVFAVLYLAAIVLMKSQFDAYLIPAVPVLFVLIASELDRIDKWKLGTQRIMVVLITASALWSFVPWTHEFAKRMLSGGGQIDMDSWLKLLTFTSVFPLVLGAFHECRKRSFSFWKQAPVFVFFITVFLNLLYYHPDRLDTCAESAAEKILERPGSTVVLIGNHPNFQLSYYLNGADLGWHRIEPRFASDAEVRSAIDSMQLNNDVTLVIERDDEPRLSPSWLPADARKIFESSGYLVLTCASKNSADVSMRRGDQNIFMNDNESRLSLIRPTDASHLPAGEKEPITLCGASRRTGIPSMVASQRSPLPDS
jgi:4-amino-4-deoxy-L-arabinose transferase-like glycosyltransferase